MRQNTETIQEETRNRQFHSACQKWAPLTKSQKRTYREGVKKAREQRKKDNE